MASTEELEAELEVARLEEEFVAAKAAGTVTMEQKLVLREARRAQRENRTAAAEEGGATVAPEVIEGTAEAN